MLTFTVADDPELLADELSKMLAVPLCDPMTSECVTIPTKAMQRWLQLRLARSLGASAPNVHDGICANITFHVPLSLRKSLLRVEQRDSGVLDLATGQEQDPWGTDRFAWTIYEVLERNEVAVFSRALTPGRVRSNYRRARRFAALFERYDLVAPEMLQSWAKGDDVDPLGRRLDASHRWQPELWRRAREIIGSPSPSERFPSLVDGLSNASMQVALPERCFFFAITFPGGGQFLELLEAIAQRRSVHVLSFEPSTAAFNSVYTSVRSRMAPSGHITSIPQNDPVEKSALLAAWGRPYVDRASLIAEVPSTLETRVVNRPTRASFGSAGLPRPRSTLLAELQSQLRDNRATTGNVELSDNDFSFQIHECFGIEREIEALHDAILHLLATDTTLEEDDVLVICPSLESVAPLIAAQFEPVNDLPGELESADPGRTEVRRLRYRVADPSLVRVNPLAEALFALFDLVNGRMNASELIDFLSLGAVRQRFAFDDAALTIVRQWIKATNVRWGLDASHRTRWGLPEGLESNTWQRALLRLLLGVAASDEALVLGHAVAYGVEGDGIDLLGRLSKILSVVAGFHGLIEEPRTLRQWISSLEDVVADLFSSSEDDAWQLEGVQKIWSEILMTVESAEIGKEHQSSSIRVPFHDLVALTDRYVKVAHVRADYFRGGVTFTSMSPFRSIPFRVIAVLGLDGSFVTRQRRDGDDLTNARSDLRDNDPALEARLALLDAISVAGEYFLVTRSSRGLQKNEEIPPCAIFSELLDAVRASLTPASLRRWDRQIAPVHSRHGFEEKNLSRGGCFPGDPWSFDRTHLLAARARRRQSEDRRQPFGHSLPALEGPHVIELADLHRFLANPTRSFLTNTLGLSSQIHDGDVDQELPVVSSALDLWSVRNRLLERRLAGASIDELVERERADGGLAVGHVGERELEESLRLVNALVLEAQRFGYGSIDEALSIDIELSPTVRVVGTLPRTIRLENGILHVSPSEMTAKRELALWLDLLAYTAAVGQENAFGVLLARGGKRSPVKVVCRGLLGGTQVQQERSAAVGLTAIVELFLRGHRDPLPLFPELSRKIAARGVGEGSTPRDGGRSLRGDVFAGDTDATLVYGRITLDDLLKIRSRSDDLGEGRLRAVRYANFLWNAVQSSSFEIDGGMDLPVKEQ